MNTFDLADLDRDGITTGHKVAIADCIMAWAGFDCLLRALLTAIEGRNLDEGAADYERLFSNLAMQKLIQRVRDQGATAAVLDAIKSHRRDFREHVVARNRIAHASCVGVWRDRPEYLVFSPFSPEGPGRMAIELMPIDVIQRSTNWAKGFSLMAHELMGKLGY